MARTHSTLPRLPLSKLASKINCPFFKPRASFFIPCFLTERTALCCYVGTCRLSQPRVVASRSDRKRSPRRNPKCNNSRNSGIIIGKILGDGKKSSRRGARLELITHISRCRCACRRTGTLPGHASGRHTVRLGASARFLTVAETRSRVHAGSRSCLLHCIV